ncbi:extracellular matrix protein precursor [Ophiocordyceps camponoti-floridani]|uniref:Extracellular matrix protein n=1 Tax=Ophiocordyceps camponoti-floridani TaxID=2030778 RepID=A0A8H4QBW2_9HYPO|nr:extracellular matrix protein precursor [Ophiocordyceps camponoti-floridani]
MKSTIAISLLAAATVQAGENYDAASSRPTLLNSDYNNVRPGQDFNLQFSGCESGCTVTVKQGQAENLQDLKNTPSFPVSGTSGTIKIPEGVDAKKVALVITDNKGNVNYSPQFDLQGAGAAPAPAPAPVPTSAPADNKNNDDKNKTDDNKDKNNNDDKDKDKNDDEKNKTEGSKNKNENSSAARDASPATTTPASIDDASSTTTTAASPDATTSGSSSSTTLTSGTRGATRTTTSSSSTRTAQSSTTRVPGSSGVGRNAVPWILSGVMAVVALIN